MMVNQSAIAVAFYNAFGVDLSTKPTDTFSFGRVQKMFDELGIQVAEDVTRHKMASLKEDGAPAQGLVFGNPVVREALLLAALFTIRSHWSSSNERREHFVDYPGDAEVASKFVLDVLKNHDARTPIIVEDLNRANSPTAQLLKKAWDKSYIGANFSFFTPWHGTYNLAYLTAHAFRANLAKVPS